jgi:tetratricopeptide (TPR) repeat protein
VSRIETYLAYLAQKPGDRFAMYSLALEHKRAGDLDSAETAFAELLRVHPQSGAGHYQLGVMRREAGRTADAITAWKAGLDALRGSTDPEARRAIGEIERALDELDDGP